ncbi:probable calcium-binding protein CML41 [Telopea speciosissima]|uniref:probable calcium-binding protein CML41 n=1 Tax=Telopea speciosissima TaxID=54955 RepID=UPI001CC3BA77|nr:probable calcium-binding protein CML41 [Telopea speciosissima]
MTHVPPVSSTVPIPPKEQSGKDELQEIFRHFDADGNGGVHVPEEAQGVINDLKQQAVSNLMLDFDEFVKLMEREGGEDDLKRAFEMFVVEKGSGNITSEGLQRMFNSLGYKISNEECKTIIQAFDCDGDGMLGFPEFQQMMA